MRKLLLTWLLLDSLAAGLGADLAAQAASSEPTIAASLATLEEAMRDPGAARDAEVHVPRDLALVSFDDPPWAELVDPPLTTLAQPVRRMASNAMQLALERVEGDRTEPRRIVLPLEFRVRSSCGVRGAAAS